MTATKLVLLDGTDAADLAGPIALSGGRVLPTPITRWQRGEWDARTFSRDRLAIVGQGLIGSDRRDVSADRAAILAALDEFVGDPEVAESAAAIRTM